MEKVIRKVNFVGIVVQNIEEAQELFSEVLGLKPWDQGIVEMPGVKAVMLPVGECSVELLQPTVGPDDPVGGGLARRLARHGEGFCRLGLEVDDVDREVERLRSSGVNVVDTGEYGQIGEEHGARMAFVHPSSASGVLVELDQQIA